MLKATSTAESEDSNINPRPGGAGRPRPAPAAILGQFRPGGLRTPPAARTQPAHGPSARGGRQGGQREGISNSERRTCSHMKKMMR